MRLLFIMTIFISISVSAQEKGKKQLIPRADTTKLYKSDFKKIQPPRKADQEKKLYKMPNAKPKNNSIYSGLKDKRKDTTDYKMLNSITPEKPDTKNQK